jgi:hypothetical protein
MQLARRQADASQVGLVDYAPLKMLTTRQHAFSDVLQVCYTH